MSNMNDFVEVSIAIENPAMSSASFNNLLLVVAKPTKAGKEMPDVVVISETKELQEYGYTEEDEAYKAAHVALIQEPRPSALYIIARKNDGEDNESITQCLDRAKAASEWYGFSLLSATATDINNAAKWAEENTRLFGFTYTVGNCPIKLETYSMTFAFYAGSVSGELPEENQYAAVALMAKCFGYDPGSETWALKSLNGILPADNLLTPVETELKNSNVTYYSRVANKFVTNGGKTGIGEWIDVLRFRDWLLNKIQIEVFDYITKNKKIPYNDSGITGIHNILNSILADAQETGGIDMDRYNGDEVAEKGYEVIVPRSAEISADDKKNRRLPGIKFTARLTGAIHFVGIKGTLVY